MAQAIQWITRNASGDVDNPIYPGAPWSVRVTATVDSADPGDAWQSADIDDYRLRLHPERRGGTPDVLVHATAATLSGDDKILSLTFVLSASETAELSGVGAVAACDVERQVSGAWQPIVPLSRLADVRERAGAAP